MPHEYASSPYSSTNKQKNARALLEDSTAWKRYRVATIAAAYIHSGNIYSSDNSGIEAKSLSIDSRTSMSRIYTSAAAHSQWHCIHRCLKTADLHRDTRPIQNNASVRQTCIKIPIHSRLCVDF